MAAVAFDTYKMVKRLRESGFTDPQAEAVTAAIQEAGSVDLSHLATKEDLTAVRTELKNDIASVKAELKGDIAAVKADIELVKRDLTIRLGAMMAASVAIVATLVKLIH